jgi:hypothetical protein
MPPKYKEVDGEHIDCKLIFATMESFLLASGACNKLLVMGRLTMEVEIDHKI